MQPVYVISRNAEKQKRVEQDLQDQQDFQSNNVKRSIAGGRSSRKYRDPVQPVYVISRNAEKQKRVGQDLQDQQDFQSNNVKRSIAGDRYSRRTGTLRGDFRS